MVPDLGGSHSRLTGHWCESVWEGSVMGERRGDRMRGRKILELGASPMYLL